MEMMDIGQPKDWPGLKLSCFLGQRKKNCKCKKNTNAHRISQIVAYLKIMTQFV